ncbi:hypothetical protein T10_6878 [Trichinella papuae]|uniref:Uncharacterized protein n=1 Tax=Trichinella papuae TaxID=268474 RepID=A0A0V1M3B4_9BILA|nr:hypothetical protein T10_6878 [Trichinella papuae]
MSSWKREKSRKVNTDCSDQKDYPEIVQYPTANTENTWFPTHMVLLRFKMMLFSLCNAPAVFQLMITTTMRG